MHPLHLVELVLKRNQAKIEQVPSDVVSRS